MSRARDVADGSISPTWDFESAEIPCGGTGIQAFSAAHGLGVKPSSYGAFAVCKTAVTGFSVGDEVLLGTNGSNVVSHAQCFITTAANATDVFFEYRNYIPHLVRPDASGTQPLNANFSVILRAKK